DPAGVVAADGEPAGTRAVDGEIVRDAQLAGGQGDGAVAGSGSEGDQVGTRLGVGVEDRLPQGPEAAVREILDQEGARRPAVFQQFHLQSGLSGARSHDRNSSQTRCGLRYHARDTIPGAQTERRGGAGPEGGPFLGGKDPSGRLALRLNGWKPALAAAARG